MERLADTYRQTNVQLSGHGKREAGVLKRAFEHVREDEPSDQYGQGKTIRQFEEKMAQVLGKESAIFFPSGTMAQQIALRIWCDETGKKKVAYHPLCHLEIHEQDGLKELHHIEPILVGDENRLMTLEEIQALPDIACLLLELPQREIGGELPTFEELVAIHEHCREKGIHLHLDGARLFESLPYYEKEASEICALFDSVYVSFYKGIGGIAGAILAGPKAFCDTSKVWKRRYGGDLISLYPYILSADYYYELRKDKMAEYRNEAVRLAARFNELDGVWTNPRIPVTNMFHLHFQGEKEELGEKIARIQEETGVGITGYLVEKDGHCSTEVSIGDTFERITREQLDGLFRQFR
ncbi:aminotransferase class I/II-fold pyridoxal phosphate-dependent enzyme [Exiguobacterium profundum]|uniref:Aminotransferase class I/II-fold pyridoxal phosphate-dependent enzyme n=1 Tax=Exiguobacterium profundum TaxID=307643 RepID=A0ABY8B1T4_9BACL|nr:aminotransferase class I/II-fold pyridoxal phosphate-dependent enzyme [Exiguobacterium profundum]WED55593.1 aminotransferase class I/II-fold pyridoxal phosphate-dependent enzyme [Exiguobacterium profundum]